MKINFTYIIPHIQQIFPIKKEQNLDSKFHRKKKDFEKQNLSCFSEILEKEIQKIKR